MATFTKRGDKYFVQIRRKGMATTCRSFHYKADAEEWARHMEAKADTLCRVAHQLLLRCRWHLSFLFHN
jgi:hypothetical protein